MKKSLVNKARTSGFKVSALAEKIGISSNYLATCLRGERKMSKDKQDEMEYYLDQVSKIKSKNWKNNKHT